MANLYIGLGGAGVKTLRELKNKKREGDYFLFVDTDSHELEGVPEDEKIDLSNINVLRYLETEQISNPIRIRVNDWLDVDSISSMKNGPLKEGTSGNRLQGRLALASSATVFKNRIKDIISKLYNNYSKIESVNTYIVLSFAGGTASSIFLDLNQVLYDEIYLIENHNFRKPITIFYMPFLNFQNENLKKIYTTNVFGFWKELDAIQRDYFDSMYVDFFNKSDLSENDTDFIRNSNFSIFSKKSDTIKSGRVPFQLFQTAILVDFKNAYGLSTEISQKYKDVSRLIDIISKETYGLGILSKLESTSLQNAVQSINNESPWIKQYCSLGYAEIRGGSELFEEYVKMNLKTILYDSFLGVTRASKDGLDELVNPIFQDSLLSFIEIDNYSTYMNGSRDENNKKINLHALIDNYWNEKININLEDQYARGIDSRDESAADGLKRLFDTDIIDIVPKIVDFLNVSGYQIDSIIKKVLGEVYEKCSEIAITEGLQKLSFVLKELDTKIDDLSMNYDSILKGLANQGTNVIVDDQDIINSNLKVTIIRQCNTIKEGPSFLVLRKDQWYENEMTKLKELIKASYKYQTQELALKLKKEICDKISLGHSGDMHVRLNVSKLIAELQTKIDNEVKPNSHKKLIEKYLSYKDNALTTIIPDVSRFATTDTFDDSKINVFKRIFENQCGLATGINNGKTYFLIKESDNSSSNSITIEELVRTTFSNSNFLINNIQNGEISSINFIEEFEKLIEENLFSNLESILRDGQSESGVPSGYSKYSAFTLNDWIDLDSASFDAVKQQFEKRGAVFCNLRDSNVAKQLWVSPKALKNRIDEIYRLNNERNIPNYNFKETIEDAIILINYVENISFDDYKRYANFKDFYKYNLTTKPKSVYPHIDVRFKNEMLDNLDDVENKQPILDVLRSI